jgi:hypothetical protein
VDHAVADVDLAGGQRELQEVLVVRAEQVAVEDRAEPTDLEVVVVARELGAASGWCGVWRRL